MKNSNPFVLEDLIKDLKFSEDLERLKCFSYEQGVEKYVLLYFDKQRI